MLRIYLNMASSKKGFDFRMSKKVAELTQVVHMLFTRNHEKEIEIDALKDAYENEIDCVIKDAKGQISDLEKQLEKLSSKTSINTDGLKEVERLEQRLKNKEEEWTSKITLLELQLKSKKLECQTVRDLLIQAQKDIEKLRESQSQEEANNTSENEKLTQEIEQMKSQIKSLKKQLNASPDLEAFQELQKNFERIVNDFATTKETLLDSEKTREQLASKNKSLEDQIKELKKEIKRYERNSVSAKQGTTTLTKESIVVSINLTKYTTPDQFSKAVD